MPNMGKNAKRETEQAKTQAKGREVFEIDAWRLRKGFECENAGQNEVGGQKLSNGPQRGQNAKTQIRAVANGIGGSKTV